MLRQHRHQADDQRQFAIVRAGKIEAHRARAENFGFFDLGVVGAVVRPPVIAQQLQREGNVIRGDGDAIGEMRRGIEREGHEGSRIVGFDALRQQTVKRKRLVVAARHQALDHVAAHRLHGEALDDQWIEAVEGAEHAFDQAAAFRRVRVGIGNRRKILRHGRRAMHGDGVSRLRRVPGAAHRGCRKWRGRAARRCTLRHGFAARAGG